MRGRPEEPIRRGGIGTRTAYREAGAHSSLSSLTAAPMGGSFFSLGPRAVDWPLEIPPATHTEGTPPEKGNGKAPEKGALSLSDSVVRPPRFERGTFRSGV